MHRLICMDKDQIDDLINGKIPRLLTKTQLVFIFFCLLVVLKSCVTARKSVLQK